MDTELENFLLKSLKEVGTDFYYISHLLLFYLIAERSWSGEILSSGERKYPLSKLVDILFIKEICKEKNLTCNFKYFANMYSLQNLIDNVRNTISCYWEGRIFL